MDKVQRNNDKEDQVGIASGLVKLAEFEQECLIKAMNGEKDVYDGFFSLIKDEEELNKEGGMTMNKAEERALEAYPVNVAISNNEEEYDGNYQNRAPYMEGYYQALSDVLEEIESRIERADRISKSCSVNSFRDAREYFNGEVGALTLLKTQFVSPTLKQKDDDVIHGLAIKKDEPNGANGANGANGNSGMTELRNES